MTTPDVSDLIQRYRQRRSEYTSASGGYSEADTRADFINPLLKALGWDVTNEKALPRRRREVERETRVAVDERTKRPDYELKLAFQRKIFVEAKKPSVDILSDPDPALQVRRYGWSAQLPISVLTNFDHLVVYDTTVEPREGQGPEHARVARFRFDELEERWGEVEPFLSRDFVYSGDFDERFAEGPSERPSETVGEVFLGQLNEWRLALAEDLLRADPSLSGSALNDITQRFLLRVLFLRMCEDRGIQTHERLKEVADERDWSAFVQLLVESDGRYNSELFEAEGDPLCAEDLVLGTDTVAGIIESLYYPAPYQFAIFEPAFLGSVYEQFLLERIRKEGGEVRLVPKPENVDKDVVSTPREVVETIVEDTLGEALDGLSWEALLEKRALDPACGSGSFLIASFDLFLSKAIEAREAAESAGAVEQFLYEAGGEKRLRFEKKSELLTSCVYGVDRDYAAVEVAKFSLLVKLLEDETESSLPSGDAILPSLGKNVAHGDALIDSQMAESDAAMSTYEGMIGPPLDWGTHVPATYDFVVGNPPYLKTEDVVNLEKVESTLYEEHYKSACKQYDKYFLFLERVAEDLLGKGGWLGMVVSRKFAHIESGKQIRKLLSKSASVRRIVDFGSEQLFAGRTTYVCLLYATEAESTGDLAYELVGSRKEWSVRQARESEAGSGGASPAMQLPRRIAGGKDCWILPNTPAELSLIEAMEEETVPLGNITEVFNGVQTSQNRVYVIKEWEDHDEYISFEQNGSQGECEKGVLRPFFDDDKGELELFAPMPPAARVLFPYAVYDEDEEKKARLLSQEEMRNNYPKAWAWLSRHKNDLRSRSITPKDYPKDEWYRYGRTQALAAFRNRPKIVVGVNSRGDRYAYDENDIFLASGGTAGECAIAHDRQAPSAYDLHFILALLSHKAVEYFCRKRGSPFRGDGWFARGTAVLSDLPVPKIDFEEEGPRLRLYEKITERSKRLHERHREAREAVGEARSRAHRMIEIEKRQMHEAISRLYGVENIIENVELPL